MQVVQRSYNQTVNGSGANITVRIIDNYRLWISFAFLPVVIVPTSKYIILRMLLFCEKPLVCRDLR